MDSIQNYLGGTPSCPVCRGPADCQHWIGWTDDGRTVELRSHPHDPPQPLLPSDHTVNTGVTTRVYRDWVF